MDVYGYLPDVISYASMRHPYSSSQQNSWATETPKEKRKTQPSNQKNGKNSCQDCPICQERRRRPLASYIRSKTRQDRCASTSISEDSEEIAEEEEKTKPVQQQVNKIPVKK